MRPPSLGSSSSFTSTPSPQPESSHKTTAPPAASASSGVEAVLRTLFGSCTGAGVNRDPATLRKLFTQTSLPSGFQRHTSFSNRHNFHCRNIISNKRNKNLFYAENDGDCCGTARAAIVLEEEDQDATLHNLHSDSEKRKYAAVSTAHKAEEKRDDTFHLKPWPISNGTTTDEIPTPASHNSMIKNHMEDFDDGISAITATTLDEMARCRALGEGLNVEKRMTERSIDEKTNLFEYSVNSERDDVIQNKKDLQKKNNEVDERARGSLNVNRKIINETIVKEKEKRQKSPPKKHVRENINKQSNIVTPPETPTHTSSPFGLCDEDISIDKHGNGTNNFNKLDNSDSMDVLARLTTLKRLVETRRPGWGKDSEINGDYIDGLLMNEDYGEI